jgi:hypothetical protein
MQLTQTLALLALAGFSVVKADVGPFPSICQSICGPVQNFTQVCDTQKNDQDNTYYSCVCGATGAASQIPLCYSCLNDNGDTGNGKSTELIPRVIKTDSKQMSAIS